MTRLPEPKQKRAALYVRVSTRGQEAEGTSLDTQEAACRRYAADRGYEVAHVFVEVHTGAELWERPQLNRLRELVRRRDVDVVVAHAIDRLSRETVHLGVILSEADHHHVAVEFVTEPLDDSPEGQLIRYVRGYAAGIERTKIRERSIRGKRARVEAGKLLPGRQALYGYCYSDDRTRYEVDPITAPIVRRVFAEVARGLPLRRVATALSDEKIPTPGGRRGWAHTTVRAIVRHPAYAGEATAWRLQAVKLPTGKRTMRVRPAAEQVVLPAGVVPPLIEPAIAEAARQRLAMNKANLGRPARDPEAALLRAGHVVCGHCGRAMYVWANAANGTLMYRCTRTTDMGDGRGRCNHAITVTILDAAAWTQIELVLKHPEVIRAKLAKMDAAPDPADDDLIAVDRDIARVDKTYANYLDNLGRVTGAAVDAINQKMLELQDQRARLLVLRTEVAARQAQRATKRQRLADIEAACKRADERLGPDAPYSRRRQAVEGFALRARVYRNDHTPRYEIDLDLEALLDTKLDTFGTGFAHFRRLGDLRLRWTDRDGDASIAAD